MSHDDRNDGRAIVAIITPSCGSGKLRKRFQMEKDAEQLNAATSRDVKSGFSGSYLVVFDAHPVAKSFISTYLYIIPAGYGLAIALGIILHSSAVQYWIKFCLPLVAGLRNILPVFQNFERALDSKGFGARSEIIEHLLAFGWLFAVPSFLFLTFVVLNLQKEDLAKLRSRISQFQIVAVLVGSTLAFAALAYWITVGFGFMPVSPLFAWHQFDLPLIIIPILFGAGVMFGILAEISILALAKSK